ncbi:glutamate-5-semialdehyde dehydrogenase [Oscillatoria sp. FACHB-1407]|uniref:glutamate-5-semialdehyde dehydrogenase n=1 Tax=Oscillatoria sp. FACHB-1407 TaxID=2692847 RepID=UPI0016852C6A|nr:glutamate-5-semialdehyde dehydrogenase [Oscillatoria sp. FACHB-1407]MBD2462034.1 glutamate-5-semialdehyde dehydrogenase [Oscillatoria sp. FACHB-1407]
MVTDSLHPSSYLSTAVQQAYQSSLELAALKGTDRSQALQVMADALNSRQDDILEANTLDLEASREMAVPDLILEWLKLTPERLQSAVRILQRLSELSDPTQQVLNTPYQVERGQTYCQLTPLGVIALVYEAFPELGAIAAGLCLRTANSLILKGGAEASHSNQVIVETLQNAIEDAKLPPGCLQLLPSDQGDLLRELITQDQYVNLVIPYGRSSLVQQVIRQATLPVLKTAIGNCYLYWSPSGSIDVARWMILDSHQSEPDPVNAIEKVLIHRQQNLTMLSLLWETLREKGYELKGDADLVAQFPELKLAEESEWGQPYLDRTITFKFVDGLEEAIGWINAYSSGHADCLATESYQESRQFALGINSAITYINASPRFYRNPKRGSPISLGMSNQKGHRRGLISLETLTTVKHVVQGSGLS